MRARVPRPLWMQLIADVLITGIALVVFAYFHHVRPTQLQSENVIIPRPTAPAVTPAPTPETASDLALSPAVQMQTPEPQPAANDWGSFAGRFPAGRTRRSLAPRLCPWCGSTTVTATG